MIDTAAMDDDSTPGVAVTDTGAAPALDPDLVRLQAVMARGEAFKQNLADLDRQRRGAAAALAYVRQEGTTPPPTEKLVTSTRDFSVEIKSIDDGAREISGIASTAEVDRLGDIVVPEGCICEPEVALLIGHDVREVVGRARLTPTPSSILFSATIARPAHPGPYKTRCDDAFAMCKSGLLRHVSIGFQPLTWEHIPGGEGVKYLSYEVLELSLCVVPAQQNARVLEVKSAQPNVIKQAAPVSHSSGLLEKPLFDFLPRALGDEIEAEFVSLVTAAGNEADAQLLKSQARAMDCAVFTGTIAIEQANLLSRVSFHAAMHLSRELVRTEVDALRAELDALKSASVGVEKRVARHAEHLGRLETKIQRRQ